MGKLVKLKQRKTTEFAVFQSKQKEFNEIELEGANLVDATKVNYQLYISAADSNQCFLLNVHTGEMWHTTPERRLSKS